MLSALFFPGSVAAQEDGQQQPLSFSLGTVVSVQSQEKVASDPDYFIQTLLVKKNSSETPVETVLGSEYQPIPEPQLLGPGRSVILAEQQLADGSTQVVLYDVFRLSTVLWLSLVFVVVVLVVGKLQGLGAFGGLILSIVVLLYYVVPQILSGANPVLVSMVGAVVIGTASLYIAHGWNSKSHIALLSLLMALTAVATLSTTAVYAAHLVGLGSEEAAFLQYGSTASINLQGLLLGGILLGALGVLDDVTVAQVSIVFQLKLAKKEADWAELYTRGLAVGKDHVASLVNTLVLAYVGANLPLFVLFVSNTAVPSWVTLNSEIIVEEIIRTLSGSIGLVLAVPITTALAAYWVNRISYKTLQKEVGEHVHTH